MPSTGEKRREQQRNQRPQRLQQQKQKRTARREWWVELKGSLECKSCGNSDWRCLEFHHRDPKTKKFSLAHSKSYSEDVIVAEMKKCDVLCANCHRIFHWEQRNK